MMPAEIATLPVLLTEREAYGKYGGYLEDKELRQARAASEIRWLRRKNRIMYREGDLVAFISARIEAETVPCRPVRPLPSSSLENTGSTPSRAQGASTVSGMTPELERSAAALLRRRI